MDIKELYKNKTVVFDGGMGTLLQKAGLPTGTLPEEWNITHPEVIEDIHTSYINAGADIIKANTFGANSLKYGERLEEVLTGGMKLARQAAEKCRKGTLVALDIGPTGKLLAPLGELDFEEAVGVFSKTVLLAEGLADIILIETMNDLHEMKAAIVAAKESSKLPIFATVALNENGKLMTGADISSVVTTLEGLGVFALGVNCGFGPEKLKPFIKEMLSLSSIPIIVNPNAGLPRVKDGEVIYDLSPKDFSEQMREALEYGANFVGGCCGTTPKHIEALAALASEFSPKEPTDKGLTAVSSYTHAVFFKDKPILIGERLNPTGKPKLKEALRTDDLSYIINESLTQVEKGADILDINVGLPEISEAEMLTRVAEAIAEVSGVPLQLDTSDPVAMERAVRRYNGKPLINSVNGKKESLEKILPIAAKYGGVVVALTLDENGIPSDADGRVAIAKKIYAEAEKYNIAKKNIIVDPLALAVSSDASSADTTLEALEKITALGGKTSLGVSNISFGLPERDRVNSVFFSLALDRGLSAAIMNPFSEAMMNSYYAYNLLSGKDKSAREYIEYTAAFSKSEKQSISEKSDYTLKEAVIRGLKKKAEELSASLLEKHSPLEVINGEIIPALDEVGEGFEKNRIFLPQLLSASEAAKSAFNVIKKSIPPSEGKGENIVLATVKGDIHDIGKNIVKVMLENYGYSVIDLGKDVPPSEVVCAVRENSAKLVGLSALMTTTVVSMEETIKALRAEGLDCKVVVGGAVMNGEYAEMIGADKYAKDATETVRYAEEIFKGKK